MTFDLLWLRSHDKFLLKLTIVGILLLSIIHIYLSISVIDFNSKIFGFLHINHNSNINTCFPFDFNQRYRPNSNFMSRDSLTLWQYCHTFCCH